MNEPVCEILFDTTRILQWKQSIGVVGLIGSDVTGLKYFTFFFFPLKQRYCLHQANGSLVIHPEHGVQTLMF